MTRLPYSVLLLMCALILALLPGCEDEPVTVAAAPPPSEAATLSQVAAAVESAGYANEYHPVGLPRTTVERELTVAAAGLPTPAEADREAATLRREDMLAGRVDAAEARYRQAAGEVAALRAQVERDRAAAAATLQDTIRRLEAAAQQARDQERARADAQVRRLVAMIFFGGAALAVGAGVLCLTVASGLPVVGPKLIGGLFTLGGVLGASGVAILTVLSHPWIAWVGLGAAGLIVFALAVLGYANHAHARMSPAAPSAS